GEGWSAATGLSSDELTGWGWLQAVHPDDAESLEESWRQSLVDHSPLDREVRVRQHDGRYRYFTIRGVPVLDASSQVREGVGAIADSDVRRRAEERLRETAERLSQALEAGQFNTWDWDAETNRMIWSESTPQWHGPPPTSLDELYDRIDPNDREKVRDA